MTTVRFSFNREASDRNTIILLDSSFKKLRIGLRTHGPFMKILPLSNDLKEAIRTFTVKKKTRDKIVSLSARFRATIMPVKRKTRRRRRHDLLAKNGRLSNTSVQPTLFPINVHSVHDESSNSSNDATRVFGKVAEHFLKIGTKSSSLPASSPQGYVGLLKAISRNVSSTSISTPTFTSTKTPLLEAALPTLPTRRQAPKAVPILQVLPAMAGPTQVPISEFSPSTTLFTCVLYSHTLHQVWFIYMLMASQTGCIALETVRRGKVRLSHSYLE